MNSGDKITTSSFMFREGDEAPKDGGCPIGGEWVRSTTDKLFDEKLDGKISEEFYDKKFEQYTKEKEVITKV